jgi:hypothetical protein
LKLLASGCLPKSNTNLSLLFPQHKQSLSFLEFDIIQIYTLVVSNTIYSCMSFEIKDLVKARRYYCNNRRLSRDFDLTGTYHGLIHHKRNRIITLAKYKKTIKLLCNLEDLQPYYDLNNPDLSSTLSSNTYMTYDVVLNVANPLIRWASEKKLIYKSSIRTSQKETWENKDSLSQELVTSLTLKASALDIVYEYLNWRRSTLVSDILLDEYIYNNRYKQAVDYLNNQTDNISLLKIYAKQMETNMTNAAKHCIFCYEKIY